ncbi:MAG UNVERIFIED_CONTAM: hypothetical protein LVR29_30860 [Microcystis novacekii LVE1205-3]|jgi:hypothetical protein
MLMLNEQGLTKKTSAKLYLEKIKKSIKKYRDKQALNNFYQTQLSEYKCSEIELEEIPQNSGKVCLKEQFLFIVYNQERALKYI